jgi:hypothetical protein
VDSGHVERSSENFAAVPIPEDMLADRDLPLATRTYSQTRVRPEGCKSAKRARRMRDSAADGSEDTESVKSMTGEWSATYAAVADRSASINSSQNEVSVALTKRHADMDVFKELFGPDSGASPAERLEYGSLLRETLLSDKRAEVQRARSVAERISVSPALAARDTALNMTILPAVVARTAIWHIPDISARNRRRLTGIYSDEDEADATVFECD